MSAIREHSIKELENIDLQFKANRYPQPTCDYLPRCFFVSLFVGSRGSGKTYSCVTLLKSLEHCGIYDHQNKTFVNQRVIVFSPTIDANPVFTSLKYLDPTDIHHDYSDSSLVETIENIKYEHAQTLEYRRKLKLYNKFIHAKSIDFLSHDELLELELMNFELPEKPRFPNGCVTHVVLDDLIGSSAFKSTGKSAVTNLALKNRHLGVNLLIMSQNLKAIPKSIRTNTSLFVLFKFASNIIIDDIYEEVSNVLTMQQFDTLYRHATVDPHTPLVIDFTAKKTDMFKKTWSIILNM